MIKNSIEQKDLIVLIQNVYNKNKFILLGKIQIMNDNTMLCS